MEPANTQLNTPDPIMIPPKSSSKNWIIIGIVIVLVLGTGIYYYQSTKGGTKTMDIQEDIIAFNDKAAVILTKDFIYDDQKSAEYYSMPYTVEDASYAIFINDRLVGTGDKEGNTIGTLPIAKANLKNGTNTLRIEVDPSKAIGKFSEKSSCDFGIIASQKGDVVDTRIDQNENILVQVSCTDFPKDVVVSQEEEEEPGVPTESQKSAAKAALLDFIQIVQTKDIEAIKKHFIETKNDTSLEQFSQSPDESFERMSSLFAGITAKSFESTDLEWTTQINKFGMTIVYIDGFKIESDFSDDGGTCYHMILHKDQKWYWIGATCNL